MELVAPGGTLDKMIHSAYAYTRTITDHYYIISVDSRIHTE